MDGPAYDKCYRNPQYHRDHYLANRERILINRRLRYRRNRKTELAASRVYALAHPEKIRAISRRWQHNNLSKDAVRQAARRALARAKSFTHDEWIAVKIAFLDRCIYCEKEKPLTIDHKIPVSKGGLHNADNIVPACLQCNSKKGVKDYKTFPSTPH